MAKISRLISKHPWVAYPLICLVAVVDALYAAYEGGYIGTMADGTLSHAAALSRGEAALFFARICETKR